MSNIKHLACTRLGEEVAYLAKEQGFEVMELESGREFVRRTGNTLFVSSALCDTSVNFWVAHYAARRMVGLEPDVFQEEKSWRDNPC